MSMFVSMEMVGVPNSSGGTVLVPVEYTNALTVPVHCSGFFENHMAAGQPVGVSSVLGDQWQQPPGLLQVPAQTTAVPAQTTATVYQLVPPNVQVVQPNLQLVQPATQAMVQGPHTSTIFFAGCSPVAQTEGLLRLFGQYGRVLDINHFRPYKGCRTSKGCGLVVFSQPCEAAAALEALHGRFVWPGARSPMVVEWCDPNKQHKRKRAQPLTPSAVQHVLTFQQQQAVPCMHTVVPAASMGLSHMPNGYSCAGQLVMSGY